MSGHDARRFPKQRPLSRLSLSRTSAMVYDVPENSKTMTTTNLSRLRTCIDGCELVVLADISTKTVLAWDGVLRLPQEHLDAICDLADEIFLIDAGADASQPETAVLARQSGVRVFVRSPEDPAEVLCAVLSASADAAQAIEACASFFEPSGGRGDAATVH